MIRKTKNETAFGASEPGSEIEAKIEQEPVIRRFVEIGEDTMSQTAARLVKSGMAYIGSEVRKVVSVNGRKIAYDRAAHRPGQVETEIHEYLSGSDEIGRPEIRLVRDHVDRGVIGRTLSPACLRRLALSDIGAATLAEVQSPEEAVATE